jgi:hypothetical protein
MFMKTVAKAGIAALFLIGCGGVVETEETLETPGTTEQQLLWACRGTSTWTRYWYSDSSKTNEVGREDCECDGTVYKYGTTRGYYSQMAGYTCY